MHLPVSLAICACFRRSCRWYSFRSGVWFLACSYSLRCSGVRLVRVCLAVSLPVGLCCVTVALRRSRLGCCFFFAARLRGKGKVWWRIILLEYSAGEPRPIIELRDGKQVYPRACGGTGPPLRGLQGTTGLSPRLRGNQDLAWVCPYHIGSIPAPAGEPLSW